MLNMKILQSSFSSRNFYFERPIQMIFCANLLKLYFILVGKLDADIPTILDTNLPQKIFFKRILKTVKSLLLKNMQNKFIHPVFWKSLPFAYIPNNPSISIQDCINLLIVKKSPTWWIEHQKLINFGFTLKKNEVGFYKKMST